jgi:hypothetical protein
MQPAELDQFAVKWIFFLPSLDAATVLHSLVDPFDESSNGARAEQHLFPGFFLSWSFQSMSKVSRKKYMFKSFSNLAQAPAPCPSQAGRWPSVNHEPR